VSNNILALFGFTLLVGCSRAAEPVSLCAIAEHPRTFDGKLVKVRAQIVSDAFEYARAIDERCTNYSFDIGLPPAGEQTKNSAELSTAIDHVFGAKSSDRAHIILATVTGIYSASADKITQKHRAGEILPTNIQDVVVRRGKPLIPPR